ncbi:MAG TPA: hypothetical protein VHR72_08640 [Gemmataceae bacterium]|jgi:transcriptional regulator with XRE-family HTH domain|nr:hypothetical protein [Gemmataceae bacterium]
MASSGEKNPGRRNADDRLILELAAGRTAAEAAKAAHVSPRTVSRRMQDEAFRSRVSAVRGEMLARALGRLADISVKAVATLEKLLKAKAEPVRLGAARSILEFGDRLRQSIEIEARLETVESIVASENDKGKTRWDSARE